MPGESLRPPEVGESTEQEYNPQTEREHLKQESIRYYQSQISTSENRLRELDERIKEAEGKGETGMAQLYHNEKTRTQNWIEQMNNSIEEAEKI